MKRLEPLRAACAVNCVVVSASFASGREVSSFFACLGWASWVGIALSAVLFGLLMGMICHFARETGASSLPGIYAAKLDVRCGDAVSVVHVMLMLMLGAVSVSTAGELGMLSLNTDKAALIGGGTAVTLALLLSLRGMRPLSALSVLLLPAATLFFAALALDPRPAQAGICRTEGQFSMRGNLPAAVLLGALFASYKAAMAGGMVAEWTQITPFHRSKPVDFQGSKAERGQELKTGRFAICCGGVFFVTLACANWALQRAGAEVWELNLPNVVLAARWGVFGYYACIYVMFLGCIASLSCSMGSLSALFRGHVSRAAAVLLTACAACLMSAPGLRPLVSVGYPMLGWVCAICLAALAFFLERKRPAHKNYACLQGAK